MGKAKNKKNKILNTFNHDYFFNREISWLEFNSRVLHEARDERTPLLERLRFLAIYSSNLDEFIMKRVGGLKRQRESEYNYLSIDGLTSEEQLSKIRELVLHDNKEQEKIFNNCLEELKNNSIELLKWHELTDDEKKLCNQYFLSNIFPILTPLSVDPGKTFPFISNLSYSFGIFLEHPYGGEKIFSRVKVPSSVHQWLPLETSSFGHLRLVNTTDIIKNNLHHLFRGMEILTAVPFRVTRNADLEHDDEDTEDLLELIEESINSRRLQEPIRLECLSNADNEIIDYLIQELALNRETDLYLYENYMDYMSLHSVADLDIPKLKHSNWRPQVMPWFQGTNIFEQIRQKDRLVHHPYESFSKSVEKFITEAALDPNVLSIKMTLYRTGDNSPFIKALINAAENGKQVVCLIELKARFDEKRNIFWAHKLEQAGVHVVYGIVGLKTHTKISLIVRREVSGQLQQYAHIATGNYNSKTAKLYTDLGVFTADSRLTTEVNEVFNYLTGTSLKIDYNELLVSPINAKSNFLRLIQKQVRFAKDGKAVRIVAKMNSLEDAAIIEALYEASKVGVKITLIVRGFCCLRPQVANLSENIKVISVIGRFLEHSRIFFFSNPDEEWEGSYYIGSADWMHRNMHGRVEVMAPIYSKDIQKEIAHFLQVMISDERSAWDLNSDGKYTQRVGDKNTGSHRVMMKETLQKIKTIDL